jgi:peptidoglycan/LPS O-acetylase OafA/YrhL
LIEQFFLVHLYDPSDGGARALGGISQSWTLVVELSFYLFLPLYAYVMRRIGGTAARDRRFRIELCGLAVLYLISIVWRAGVFWAVDDGAVRVLAQYWLPAQLDLFAMGMFLAVVRTWQRHRDAPVPVLEMVGRFDWLWWICAFVVFTAVTYWVGLPVILETVWGGKAYAKQFLYGFTAFFLLLPAVFGPQDRGPVRRLLRFAPIAYLGMISYGIYLWHQAFIKKVHQWGGWAPGPGENALLSFRGNFLVHVVAALALSVIAATISWYLIERPILRRKNQPLWRSSRA